jgi:hypothetical protein
LLLLLLFLLFVLTISVSVDTFFSTKGGGLGIDVAGATEGGWGVQSALGHAQQARHRVQQYDDARGCHGLSQRILCSP